VPLFGGEKREAANEDLAAEVARLQALALPELAEQTIVKVFGAGGLGADGTWLSVPQVAGALIPGETMRGLDQAKVWEMNELAGEALQVAEHAGLVRFALALDEGTNDNYQLRYTMTRNGRAAVDRNAIAQAIGG
jgi:hypothetical protein